VTSETLAESMELGCVKEMAQWIGQHLLMTHLDHDEEAEAAGG
jgi:hypothetical protein